MIANYIKHLIEFGDMKKSILLPIIAFLALPLAFADISITAEQHIYNLGNRIKVSASLMQDKSFDGLFRLELLCGAYGLSYFLTPVSLEADFRTAVSVPEVTATAHMMGNCTIVAGLLTNDNILLEEKESNSFFVTNQIMVLPVKAKFSSLPGDSIDVTGILNEAFGNNVLKASSKIRLGNKSYDISADNGRFSLTIPLPKNIKSGSHIIQISSLDAKGNEGSSSIELDITAIPIYIKLDLKGNSLAPGSKLYTTPYLYDQADDLVNESIELELDSPRAGKIFRKNVQGNKQLDYEFSQYAEPGIYTLSGAYKDLLDKASINITEVREVKIEYKNETVLVENVGNVLFQDEITFILESGLKKYPVIKKISVEPGKIINIDLSEEVPFGIYDVAVGLKDSIRPLGDNIGESINKTLGSILPQELLASGATIHDNRPIYKKIESSLSSISGTLVGSDGVLSKNPIIAPMILAVILLLIVARYGSKPIMKLIRRKKDGKTKDKYS